jgi:hypothetical protein
MKNKFLQQGIGIFVVFPCFVILRDFLCARRFVQKKRTKKIKKSEKNVVYSDYSAMISLAGMTQMMCQQ